MAAHCSLQGTFRTAGVSLRDSDLAGLGEAGQEHGIRVMLL